MKLPSRKSSSSKATSSLPKDFLHSVSELLKKQFRGKTAGATFLVYGDLYPQEIVLCVSLSHPKSLRSASLHVSSDLSPEAGEKPEKVTNTLKEMVDLTASWFSQGLEKGKGLESVLGEMDGLDSNWQEVKWEGHTFHVKLNRDNYTLEKVANDFLKKSGFRDNASDELEDLLAEEETDSSGKGRTH